MSHEDERIILAVGFTVREICKALGGTNECAYNSTDELVAALDDKQVHEVLEKLRRQWF